MLVRVTEPLLAEAFIFNESTTAIVDSVDRLREVEAALLGVKA